MKPLVLFDQDFIEGLHVVLGALASFLPVLVVGRHVLEGAQGSLVHDLLLADLAPARHDRVVVLVRRPAMHEIARPVFVEEVRIEGKEYQYGSDMASRWYR